MLGGALGSLARHGVSVATARIVGDPAPWATAAVNVIGSLVIGLLAGLLAANRLSMSLPARAFVFVGILGGFTTFSSFMLDSVTLIQIGGPTSGAANLVGQLVFGLLVTYAGYYAGLRL